MPEDLKVGVFICECGGNISDTVDIQKVKDSLNVEVVEQFVNLCSLNGRKIIRDAIFDHHLDRVVIAACSPINFSGLCSAIKSLFDGYGKYS